MKDMKIPIPSTENEYYYSLTLILLHLIRKLERLTEYRMFLTTILTASGKNSSSDFLPST